MRLILDTNIFVIALIGKGNPKIYNWLLEKKITLLFSEESLNELIEVYTDQSLVNCLIMNQLLIFLL